MQTVIKGVYRTIQILLITVVGLVLTYNVYIGFSRIVLKNEYPTFFGLSCTAVVSGSMSPSIEKGDLIVVVKQNEYAVGDVISFKDEIGVVSHRIVEVTSTGYITWGDNREVNNVPDKEISRDMVYGKVVNVIPNLGTTVQFLKTPAGMVSSALILLMVIFIPIIFDKIKESSNEEPNKTHVEVTK